MEDGIPDQGRCKENGPGGAVNASPGRILAQTEGRARYLVGLMPFFFFSAIFSALFPSNKCKITLADESVQKGGSWVELLVKKAQRGDAEAFITLIEENKQSMYKVARGFLSSDEDIADAISETVLDCYEKISTLKQSSYFKTWMIRILINNCKDMIRKRRGDISLELISEAERQETKTDESLQGFREMVAPLQKKDQSIFTLYYVYGLKIKEIAAYMEMKENTVTSRLKRGKETLRREMTAAH